MSRRIAAITAVASLLGILCPVLTASAADPPPLAEPVVDGAWIRPSQNVPAMPVWGHKDGIAVGLWPTRGPRGLIRIYTPYLGQQRPRMLNFIAIEPIVDGERGLSELEVGEESGQRGLAVWAADSLEKALIPADPTHPPRGCIERRDGIEVLTFHIATEPFRNGARPVIEVILRKDRPHEVGFRVFAAEGSAPMEACVLTATMGNYARLRHLWLDGEVIDARQVWPEFEPDPLGFAPWREWDRDRLLKQDGSIIVAATPNEPDPARAAYEPDVPSHWRYQGRPATQYWRAPDAPGAVARVNGRTIYWGGIGTIPGGVSYENFELKIPFTQGQEFWFGAIPGEPDELGFDLEIGSENR